MRSLLPVVSLITFDLACDYQAPQMPQTKLDERHGFDVQDEQETDSVEEVAYVPEEPMTADQNDPSSVIEGFHLYRIKILEMKQSCAGDAVNISKLIFSIDGELLVDTFQDALDDPDPNQNRGKIGPFDATLSTSGNYTDFYPYEAFGGGFGAGWWSEQGTFSASSPHLALSDVWFQVSFGDQAVLLDSVFIDGGTSAIGDAFVACAPSHIQILGSHDQGNRWQVLAEETIDTQAGVTINLDQSKLAIY
ncbi:hypothetical protein [Pseudobacteriovorax antillogorgiicola]|uniref:Uncharacterized protein n=1 Tax=Pseudobacteriovorax antillogorgiicola TaxID=1513793 RepID=A0A1Y6BFT4_9BACT|nr:hypothetical protein [Pseudobacteriovorax antillogorgiicola]TCS56274.1 hypothetical protein EDD56_10496 [Pseudobacteriovorax antillogorgiicola]SMF07744.1 hypothetical protein SAMN06296036_104237 [Pseudobacteriovorax antillogorgiicola]